MKIRSIDHIVISARDIECSFRFYTEILGLEPDRSHQRYAVRFGNQKINLHDGKAEFLPAAKHPTYGSADICLLAEGNITDICGELKAKDVIIEEGPVTRQGAQGTLTSIYVRDPDGNLIEISTPA